MRRHQKAPTSTFIFVAVFFGLAAFALVFLTPFFRYGTHHDKVNTTGIENRLFDLEQVVQIGQPVAKKNMKKMITIPLKPSVIVTDEYYRDGHLMGLNDMVDVELSSVVNEPMVFNGTHYISQKVGLEGIDTSDVQKRINDTCPPDHYVTQINEDGSLNCSLVDVSLAGHVEYQGTWNAMTNTPLIAPYIGVRGHYYVVSITGTTMINGISDWMIGDWIIYNGNIWEKADHTDAVHSVAGKTGAVLLDASDITSGMFDDARISNTSVAQHAGVISHYQLQHSGSIPHVLLDAHVGWNNIHRPLDDGTPSTTSLWSSWNTMIQLAGKSNNGHTHVSTSITDFNTSVGSVIDTSKGVPNGIASLDAMGMVPESQLNVQWLEYQGTWNAATNTPTIISSAGVKGHYYVVSVSGMTNIDGVTDWIITDWIVFNGAVWEKSDHSSIVTSVAGKVGMVTLTAADIISGTFTNARISQSSVIQHEAAVTHANIIGIGTKTHAEIDSHINDLTVHRTINDMATSVTNLWSSSKISTDLAGKAATSHSHVVNDITDFSAGVDARITLQKAIANGLATLDATGQIPAEQIPITGGLVYKGTWNPDTNTPILISGNGTVGDFYVCSTNGTTDLDGITTWEKGNFLIFNGMIWEKIISDPDAVSSVNGKVGIVEIVASDITMGTFGDSLISQSSVTQHETSINHDNLLNYVANKHIDHSLISINTGEGLVGGGTIDSSQTISLDISTLSTESVVDGANDFIAMYDSSENATRKVLISNLPIPNSINWVGSWTVSTIYNTGDAVYAVGTSYICKLSHTSSASDIPGIGVNWQTYWDLLAVKGDNGVGSTINVSEEGTVVPGGPHSNVNFVGASVTATDGGSGVAIVTIKPKVDAQQASSVTPTQTSLALTLMGMNDLNSMTLTTINNGMTSYMISFSGTYSVDSSFDRILTCVVNVGGVDIPSSEMQTSTTQIGLTTTATTSTMALNIANGVVIKIRWGISDGDTATMTNRNLNIYGVY